MLTLGHQSLMKRSRIKILLVCSVVLTIVSIIIIHRAIINSRKRTDLVFHTYDVIGKATGLLTLLTDCETASRGYLITQDSAFLVPLLHAEASLSDDIASIHDLVKDNKSQLERFDKTIQPLIQSKLVHLNKVLNVKNSVSLDSAFKLVKAGAGRITMDSIRYEFDFFTAEEKRLLDERLSFVNQTNSNQVVILYSSSLVIILVSLLSLFKIQKEQCVNDRLLSELNNTNQQLEDKVKDRTKALNEKNALAESLNEKLIQTLADVQSFYDALQVKYYKTEDALIDIRNLYDNALCGYHSLGPDGTFLRMNNTELNWLGYSREEVIGKKKIIDVISLDDIDAFNDSYPKFREKGFIRNMRHNYMRKDGSIFPVVINATATYDDHGNYVMSRATVIDISEIKEMEERLIAANKNLLNLNEEKNSLISVVAHDLKSPLSGILGLLNIIKYDNTNLTTGQLEYLVLMERSCQSMQGMIHNILDFNRIEQGLNAIYLEEINIIEFTEALLKPLKEQATTKNISLDFERSNDAISLKTDKSAFTRILDNLVSNALKFSNSDTRIVVRITDHKKSIKIEVDDQGPGIKEEEMSRLFAKYQKLSARPTAGESSSGLGLSIVKELVQALNGNVSVFSVENKGSNFVVELPVT
jgi:PAS domain S-box-containing protein